MKFIRVKKRGGHRQPSVKRGRESSLQRLTTNSRKKVTCWLFKTRDSTEPMFLAVAILTSLGDSKSFDSGNYSF